MKMRAWWLLCVVVAVCLATCMYKKPPTSSGDWATWVQAIGSVGAIFSVLWIAGRDRRQKQSEQAVAADVTAVAVIRTNIRALPDLVAARDDMQRLNKFDGPPEKFDIHRDSLIALRLPTEEQLLRLTLVPGNAARQLSHAIGLIAQAENQLRRAALPANRGDENLRKQFASSAFGYLDLALKNIAGGEAALLAFTTDQEVKDDQRKADS